MTIKQNRQIADFKKICEYFCVRKKLLPIRNFLLKQIQNQNPFKKDFIIIFTVCAVTGIGGFLLCLYERIYGGIDASIIFRDPNAIAENPFYFGLISNLGAVFWAAAAAITLQTGFILRHTTRENAVFFLLFGILSAFLCADDLFMLHETALPAIGAPEFLTHFIEAALLLYIMLRFSKFILEGFWLPLFLALSFLAFSVLLDEAFTFRAQTTMEDTFKIIGITFWLYYFCRVSSKALKAGTYASCR
jgi:hypothetical protein